MRRKSKFFLPIITILLFFFLFVLFGFPNICFGDDEWILRYNYFDDTWEYTPDNSRLKYNYMEDTWQYVPDYNYDYDWEYDYDWGYDYDREYDYDW